MTSPPHTSNSPSPDESLARLRARRSFIQRATAGTIISALGGAAYVLQSDDGHAERREDGRPRLPPGQRLLKRLKPMGGVPGNPRTGEFNLRVHGAVKNPYTITFSELVALGGVTRKLDVHCVTGWSVFDASFRGVPVKDLAARAGVMPQARHVVFEAAHGYTANTTLEHALHDDVLVTWEQDSKRLARAHGAPVRLINPELYFWKSPKWLTGIRFVHRDEPGYWENRGYNNHADPWKAERYA